MKLSCSSSALFLAFSHPAALAAHRLAAVVGAACDAESSEQINAEAEACQQLLQVLRSANKEARAEAVTGALPMGPIRISPFTNIVLDFMCSSSTSNAKKCSCLHV